MNLEKLLLLVQSIRSFSGKERVIAIKKFQEIVWDGDEFQDEALNEAFLGFAYDLDFYHTSIGITRESDGYFGDEELEKRLDDFISMLQKYPS